MKRKLGHYSDSDENLFNLGDYKLNSLDSLSASSTSNFNF